MKSPIIALPLLLQIVVIAALYLDPPSAPVELSTQTSATEIHQLQQQRDRIEARLSELENRTRPFNPRGFGRVSNTPASSTDNLSKQESK